jgi:D-amino-acid oxidase
MTRMDRRTLLKVGGLAALGAGFGGCATRAPARMPSRAPVILAPVNVSWNRIIRTTVGLRPFRPSGFVLRAEKLDSKTLIHNYGHGGAGVSLSWGCGQRAAEMALEATATGPRRAAVVGCGAVGLAAARQLQRRGFDVTIYAASVPPDTTSNMSLAGFTPTSSVVALDRRTPQWDTQFADVVELAYRQLQLLVGRDYGVSWLYNYSPVDDLRAASGRNILMPAHLQGAHEVLDPGEHPLPSIYAARRAELRIEPSIYLDAVLRDVALFGGRIVIRKFTTPRDLLSLEEPVIVNCTGLGARELFGDEELTPLKGQLTVLLPQPEVDYATTGAGRVNAELPGGGLHMMPRADGIVLGGTRERDVWTLEPNQNELKRVVEGHRQFFMAMRPAGVGRVARAVGIALVVALMWSPVAAQEMTGTFSIVARDPATGELGVGVHSRAFAVGSRVPHAKAGVGAIATQASTNVAYGVEGLALLEKGISPEDVVTRLTGVDERRDRRQLAVLDASGRVKAYTGSGTNAWAGHIEGENYSVQGNILAGEAVVKEMARAFERTKGELAERLMAALDAAQAAGGDKRGVQSAALLVVKPIDSPDRTTDKWVDLRVDDSTNPLGELRRLLAIQLQARRR